MGQKGTAERRRKEWRKERKMKRIIQVSVRSRIPAPLDLGPIQRRSEAKTAKGPPEHKNPATPPREEQGRVLGETPSSHSADAPGSCNDEPTGPTGSRL
ncbi:hypothetical protein ILYODFUR_024573 [Ilyodon furcidens]|uniref:Uncharacterized protein n=1 Tax=Ilyodon furcidens TaxID=33524 RepID=A0ABV0UUY2_9TELE